MQSDGLSESCHVSRNWKNKYVSLPLPLHPRSRIIVNSSCIWNRWCCCDFPSKHDACKSVDTYLKVIGYPYLHKTLGSIVKSIYTTKQSFEVCIGSVQREGGAGCCQKANKKSTRQSMLFFFRSWASTNWSAHILHAHTNTDWPSASWEERWCEKEFWELVCYVHKNMADNKRLIKRLPTVCLLLLAVVVRVGVGSLLLLLLLMLLLTVVASAVSVAPSVTLLSCFFLTLCIYSLLLAPSEFMEIFSHIRTAVMNKWPTHTQTSYICVSTFLFLRHVRQRRESRAYFWFLVSQIFLPCNFKSSTISTHARYNYNKIIFRCHLHAKTRRVTHSLTLWFRASEWADWTKTDTCWQDNDDT